MRLDIDETVKPDIVASLTDLGDIGEFDLIYCSHTLEHLYYPDAIKAVSEFHRVLKKEGGIIINVPNLEGIVPTFDIIYESVSGPITGHHMIYGYPGEYWAHRTGFTKRTLNEILRIFRNVSVIDTFQHTLTALGQK